MSQDHESDIRKQPGTGKGSPPDIEQLARQFSARVNTLLPGGSRSVLFILLFLVLLLGMTWSAIYTVPSGFHQVAVC